MFPIDTTKLSLPNVRLPNRRRWWYLFAFLCVYAISTLTWQAVRETSVGHSIVANAIVKPVAALIHFLTPNEILSTNGETLIGSRIHFSVRNGCEGMDALCLLWSAVLVSPGDWTRRIAGLFSGTAFLFLFNEGRITALYYCCEYNKAWFEVLHGFVAPAAAVLLCAWFFNRWQKRGEN